MFQTSLSHVGVRMSAALSKLEKDWINTLMLLGTTLFLCLYYLVNVNWIRSTTLFST